jgi:CrcB protein
MFERFMSVFIGGGLGASLRYWLSGLVPQYLGSAFPYGTLAVNAIGCFVLGILMTSIGDRLIIHSNLRVFLTIGLIGGFTTFSTFSYETIALLRDGEMLRAGLYVGASVMLSLGAMHLGTILGKMI